MTFPQAILLIAELWKYLIQFLKKDEKNKRKGTEENEEKKRKGK